MKLLIAEDDLTSRTLLAAVSRKWGYTPIAVEDGESAWRILCEPDPPRLLLIDWMMPHLDGPALCRRIRQNPANNPPFVILLTARNETGDIVAGLEAGANDYVAKPFENAELQARLQVGRRMLDLQEEINQARERLAIQATHDELTGILNRRAIMKALENEIQRSARRQQSLCIGMCDIDKFKRVNDTYGHLSGDTVIREVAQRISAALRPYDAMGRYGGEEFLLLLNTTTDQAPGLFERIRLAIAATPILIEGKQLEVTVSCGVAIFTPPDDHRISTTLLGAADAAMYQAKSEGRNCTVIETHAA